MDEESLTRAWESRTSRVRRDVPETEAGERSRGGNTSFSDDGLDRLTQIQYADLSTTAYTYDAGNRVTQIVDSVSGTITRGFDGLDRLTSETTPQGTVSYTYDNAGRRASMTVQGQSAVSYCYDNANRLTQITQGTCQSPQAPTVRLRL